MEGPNKYPQHTLNFNIDVSMIFGLCILVWTNQPGSFFETPCIHSGMLLVQAKLSSRWAMGIGLDFCSELCNFSWFFRVFQKMTQTSIQLKGESANFFFLLFLSISPSNLYQIQKARSVLKSGHSQLFKTVLTFEFWPSRS